MADIFISYKSERRPAAQHLARVLEHYGYSVWFDYGLLSGRDFGRQIEQELRAAPVTLVLWCSQSVNSEWVLEEAHLAKKLGTLTPAWIEQVDLPMGFLRANTLDMTNWTGAPRSHVLDQLLREIALKSGKPPVLDFQALTEQEQVWRSHGAPNMLSFELEEDRSEQAEATWRGQPLNQTSDDVVNETTEPQGASNVSKSLGLSLSIAAIILCSVAATAAVTAYMMRAKTTLDVESVAAVPQPGSAASFAENSIESDTQVASTRQDVSDQQDPAYEQVASAALAAQTQKIAYDVALAKNTGDGYRAFLAEFGEGSPYSATIIKRLAGCQMKQEPVTTVQTKTLTGENTQNGKDRTAVCLLAARPIIVTFKSSCEAIDGTLGDITVNYMVWGGKRFAGAEVSIEEPELVEFFGAGAGIATASSDGSLGGMTSNVFTPLKRRKDCEIELQGLCRYESSYLQDTQEVCE